MNIKIAISILFFIVSSSGNLSAEPEIINVGLISIGSPVAFINENGDMDGYFYHIAKDIEVGEADYIGGDEYEILAFFRQQKIQRIIIVGVSSNICVLGRRFGVIEQLKFGFSPILVRDLVDVGYTPEDYPHITVDKANEVMAEWYERHLCPTATKEDF